MQRICKILLVLVAATLARAGDGPATPPAPAADAKLVRSLRGAVERAATAEKEENRAKAAAALREAPRLERVTALVDSLGHGVRAVRIFAAHEIAEAKETGTAAAVVGAAVREGAKEVRVELFKTLRALEARDTGVHFARHLAASDAPVRFRALLGLGVFRDRRAVNTLIEHLSMAASGFGQAVVDFTTQRALITDWQLISGGTGLVVVEVADPEIGVVETGVAMEVKVRRAEIGYTVAVLQDLTGQSIGADPGAWRAWVAANPEFPLAPPKSR